MTAYEIDMQMPGEGWARVPRRCADLIEAKDIALKLVDLYPDCESFAVRFRKVE